MFRQEQGNYCPMKVPKKGCCFQGRKIPVPKPIMKHFLCLGNGTPLIKTKHFSGPVPSNHLKKAASLKEAAFHKLTNNHEKKPIANLLQVPCTTAQLNSIPRSAILLIPVLR